ncbi:MAG TPA: integrase core domain-containing protein [Candidatus Saccharimonadales bacterium]|jgi:transposase InsO family protein|nr:integrase core domain-containing protein [Candidatus Saccharimonadales bacterium]
MYTSNPNLPRVRMQAVLLLRKGWSTRKVARHLGFSQSVVVKWSKRAPADGRHGIPTRSSRPKSHPRTLKPEIVAAIITERQKHGRCAEVVYEDLKEQGVQVSLSSVKRTLTRHEMLKTKKYHRQRIRVPRPPADAPGHLVEADTVHILDWTTGKRFYLYTLLDVHSRWAYVELHERLRAGIALQVVLRAQAKAGFNFQVLQTDNGPEFAVWFREQLQAKSEIVLRHSRVRKPTDNAHVERFNRTIQEECFGGRYATLKGALEVDLEAYLDYYNNRRRHMGINMARPAEMITRS